MSLSRCHPLFASALPQPFAVRGVSSYMRVLLSLSFVLWMGLMGLRSLAAQGFSGQEPGIQRPGSVAEQYLFQAANAERQQRGLPTLRWDAALYRAATSHALEMAARESISHQYPGEADLAGRAGDAGARFSLVQENVAEAPSAVVVHRAWMESEGHRENLLDPAVNRVGISVRSRNGELYAVEDFDRGVESVSYDDQEIAIADLLRGTPNLLVQVGDEAARATCTMEEGYAGLRRPWFVMRFTTGELDALPAELQARLESGRYHEAVVAACAAKASSRPFSSYNIAILLYP